MAEKTVILIPAFNEEKVIGRTIDLIKKTGVKARIIVIDDGSKDRTAAVARSKGCQVIRFKQNKGKTNAFYAGLKEALKLKASTLITLDADMLRVPKKALKEMIAEAGKATRERRIEMVIARVIEKGAVTDPLWSGVRAFSLPALYKIRSSKIKSLPKGYALERFLNDLFQREMPLSFQWLPAFEARRPLRSKERVKRQRLDLKRYKRKRIKAFKKAFKRK